MAHRNIHQSKRPKSHKPAAPAKPAAQAAVTSQPVVSAQPAVPAVPLKTAPVKAAAIQETASVRFAELPYELRRIALFSAGVVVLLIVLWFFLK